MQGGGWNESVDQISAQTYAHDKRQRVIHRIREGRSAITGQKSVMQNTTPAIILTSSSSNTQVASYLGGYWSQISEA